MVEIISVLIFLGVIFFFLYRKDKADRQREEDIIRLFDNTVRNVLDQVEANTEKFYEMTGKMQIKHFENLEKHTSKLLKLLEQKPVQIVERKEEVTKLDTGLINDIEKIEEREDPFSEENRIPIIPGLKVQFEGEETVHPIDIE
ncbi:hypothetical protein M0R04_13470 [Candidatus Dojkabacteria bacterium]|jgi:hypothetical protein|nr:hypothetical protein [Candidatus Dojkabacteria bacterium]